MRALKYVVAAVSAVVGGFLLLLAHGISSNMQARAQGWNFEVPSHPVGRIVVYTSVAVTLQLISAWLLTPTAALRSARDARSGSFWAAYATRVIILFGAAILTALILRFL